MRRREFLGLLGSAATCRPFAAGAQQAAPPAIGLLSSRSRADSTRLLDRFKKGLAEAGLTDGQNVTIDYRFADGQYDRLAVLAAELASSPISVLVAVGGEPAAASASAKLPVLAIFASDPVRNGLVDSLSHPGRNLSGASILMASIEPKRIGLMHDILPQAKVFGALLNPNTPTYASSCATCSRRRTPSASR